LPPVGAQNRNAIAVQSFTVDADNDFFSRQHKLTPSVSAVMPFFGEHTGTHSSRSGCALGNVNANFGIRD
jgi:hypothetical protein